MHIGRQRNERSAREHLEAFWHNSSLGRPAVHIVALDPTHTPNPYPRDGKLPKEVDLDPAAHAWTCDDVMRGGLYLAETMPALEVNPGHGLALLALLAGGDYDYRHDQAWLRPMPDLLATAPPVFDPTSPVTRRLDACYRAAADALRGRGILSCPTIVDPLTTLSQLARAEETAMAIYTDRERLDRWVDSLTQINVEAMRHFTDVSGMDETTIFWGPLAPAPASVLQCDFAVMISPGDFEALALPMLRRIAEPMQRTLYHLDGTAQMRFLDCLQQIPACKGIQWNPETGFAEPSRHLGMLKEIKRRGLLLYLHVASEEEAICVCRELGPDGLFLKFPGVAASEAAAAETLDRLTQACV